MARRRRRRTRTMTPAAKAASKRNLEKARAARSRKAGGHQAVSRSGKVVQYSGAATLRAAAKKVAAKAVSRPVRKHSTRITAKSIGNPAKIKVTRKTTPSYRTPTRLHGKAVPAALRKQFPKITPNNYYRANKAFLSTMHVGVQDPLVKAIPKRNFRMPTTISSRRAR